MTAKREVKTLINVFSAVHAVIAALFALTSLCLIVIAVHTSWMSLAGGLGGAEVGLIEAMGLMAIAVVSLQIAQTITEEEVIRGAHVSGPTRVRRFVSRFLVVVVVALAVEGLIAVFKAARSDLTQLPYAAAVIVSAALLLAGWGVFVWLNCAAEALEPEAMAKAKGEDKKLG